MNKLLILAGIILTTFSMKNSKAQIQSKEVKEIVEKARTKFGLPSIAVSIINSDSILLTEIQGVRKHDTNDKVSKDNFYHIGSCSKSVLAIIAAQLIEKKKSIGILDFLIFILKLRIVHLTTITILYLKTSFYAKLGYCLIQVVMKFSRNLIGKVKMSDMILQNGWCSKNQFQRKLTKNLNFSIQMLATRWPV
jgi:hypothetical protein